jgi:hypothetical protein
MISDDRAQKALVYLAESDLSCANAKADMERAEFKVKTLKQTVFLHSEGTVAERTALSDTHESVAGAHSEYCDSIAVYQGLHNKRCTEGIVMDTWRTIQANRRRGE